MEEAAIYLSRIHALEFPTAGFSGDSLKMVVPLRTNGYRDYAQQYLSTPRMQQTIPQTLQLELTPKIQTYDHLYPGAEEHTLTHGDFDPSNILVDVSDGISRTSSIGNSLFRVLSCVTWPTCCVMLKICHLFIKTPL